MPIRWRLTIWYTAVLLVVLLLIGSSVYLVLEYSLTAEIERNLENKAEEVIKSTKVVGSLPFFLRQVVLPDVEVFAAPDIYLQVITREGEAAVRSNNLGQYKLPVPEEALEEILQGNKGFTSINVAGEKLRMLIRPIMLDNNIVGFLQVARPLSMVTEALNRLKIVLLFCGGGGILLSLGLGWFMSNKVLAPIRSITTEAGKIGQERSFERRVSYSGPADELGELTVTFNDMLASLEEAYKKMAGLLETQRRFVADASHELRTPLTSIQGNVDFLLSMSKERVEDETGALEDVSAETKRLARMVRELLLLARADSGFKPELKHLEFYPVLEEAVRQARFMVKGQKFTFNTEGAKGIIIEGDGDYLKQMLLAFLDNAFKYTPAEKEVKLSVEREKPWIKISLSDEGPGISQKELPHIFERFYRAQASRSGDGTGLGLAIAKWIVDEHKGEIKVESGQGKGTNFIIKLPILRLF